MHVYCIVGFFEGIFSNFMNQLLFVQLLTSKCFLKTFITEYSWWSVEIGQFVKFSSWLYGIYTHMCTCMHSLTYSSTHARTHACTHVRTHAHTHICFCTWVCTPWRLTPHECSMMLILYAHIQHYINPVVTLNLKDYWTC